MSDPSRINDPAVRALSRQLVDMQRRLDRIEKGSRATQLGRSSIDDGYLLFTDGAGNVRGRAGRQVDGKFGWGAVNGDPPPRPNTPQLVGTTAGFNILWNGEFAGIKPSDFTYTVAYASPAGDTFIVDDSLIVGRLFGAGVIPVTAINGLPIDPELSYWVRLVSYNSSGVASEASFTAGPVQSEPVVATEILDGIVDTLALADDAVTAAKIAVGQIGVEHVTFTAADLGSIVTYAQAAEPGGTIATGSLWLDTDDGNKLRRWDGDSWELATDADIAAALAAATAAQTDAAAALDAATDAQATADGKVTVFYQAAAPSSGMGTGDLWIDTDNDNLLSRWSGSAWVAVDDQRIADALADAATAQSTADGKIVSFWQAAEPAAVAVGDLWYDTDAGNRASRWNGATWTALPAGTDAIDDDAITSPKIVAETIQALHIAAEQIFGSHIAAGTITGDKIQALSIVAGLIAANAIEAGHITAGAVTADKLEAILVLASQIIAGDPAEWHLELGDSNTPILYWNNEETGFAVSRDQATGQANVYLSGRVEFGNGSQIESDYLDLAEQGASGFQEPRPRQKRSWTQTGPTAATAAFRWVSATQPGNLLLISILVVAASGSTPPTITAPLGWSQAATATNGAARLSLYQLPNAPTSHTSDTFTANLSSGWTCGLYEYSSMAASPLDVTATATGTGTTASTGTTATTTQTAELQVAIWGSRSIGAPPTQMTGSTNGFTQVIVGGSFNGQGFVTCSKNVTATGTAQSSATLPTSQPWLGLMATFKAAAAAGVPPTPASGTLRMFSRSRAGYSTPHVVDNTGAIYPTGRVPYCRVRNNADFAISAMTDIWAQSAWVAAEDPYSMAAISASPETYTNITIPISGRWLVSYRSIFDASTDSIVNAACFVTKNARDAANSIARDSRRFMRYGGGDLSPVQAIRPVTLAANDILYFGNWSQIASSVKATVGGLYTEINVCYLGPA